VRRDEGNGDCAYGGLGAYGAFGPTQPPQLLYAPTSPMALCIFETGPMPSQKKIRDFWGILGRLSRRIGEGGMREEQGSDQMLR